MPGLHRIILIDTHLPGVVELKLNGHTNICGTNASGKTTLQRLIPVFYGEYPSRVVPATRDSFERWYLPRESSYIIYEYLNHDEDLCQGVLTSNGTGVTYRLIGKPFELDDYVFKNKAGDHVPTSPQDVVRSLKRNNVMVTNQLSTKDYRAVVQNDITTMQSSSSARELMGYARIFSMCESKKHLRHIEKLAKAVHSKEGKMETIKAMIAAILEEDGVQPPTSNLSRKHVDDWLRECQLIQEFDVIRPEFSQLETADVQLTDTEQRLAALSDVFSYDHSFLAAHIIEQQSLVDDTIHAIKQLENDWQHEREELNQTLSAAKGDITKYEQELDNVEDEYQRWQDQDIDQLQSNVKQLDQWQEDLQTAQSRYQLVTDKHQDIQSTFDKRVAELTDKFNRQLETLNSKQRDLLEQRAIKQREGQQQRETLKDDFQQQRDQLKEAHQAQNSESVEQRALLSARLQNVGFSEFEQSQLDILDATIDEAVSAEDIARDQLRKQQKQLTTELQARSTANESLQKCSREVMECQSKLDKAESLLHPKDNTLLAFLREANIEWENTIGKVLTPELLERKDLKPSLNKKHDATLFGLKLDLSHLDLPEYAQTEQALKLKLAEFQEALSTAVECQSEAEQQLTSASERVRQAELAVSKAESQLKSAEANRKRSQQDRHALHREYQAALAERKQQSKKQLQQIEAQQTKLKAQFSQALADIDEQMREALSELDFHWQQVVDDIVADEQQVSEQLAQAKANAKRDRQDTEKWLADELANRGVDVDEIGSLKKLIEQLKKDIDYTERHRHLVVDYQRWYKHVFSEQKVTWQKLLTAAKKTASKAERTLTEHAQQVKSKREQLVETQTQAETLLRQANEANVSVEQLTKSLAKLSLKVESESGKQPPASDLTAISQRVTEANELLQQRERLLTDIRAYVERFDQLIAAQAGTGLSDTWERSREECTTIDKEGTRHIVHRRLVSHLARLLNEIVPQKMQGLREQGRIFGADLTQYYYVLDDIDKRISTQSRRISKEVDEELYLDGVSDSAVKIRSKISELEFWPELEAFQKQYQQWMSSGATELPDEEYGLSMRRVLDILGRAALSGGISKLLDIELHLKEGNSNLVIRTDRQLNESSSHGMAYLILCKFLLAFTRLLRDQADVVIHWPIDELGTLHQSNVKKIFDACQNNDISVVGAFPNPESEVLKLFQNRYLIDKATRRLQVVQPKVSQLSERLKARMAEEASA
ncbi:ATP-binding protein [Alteromonas facilis]|uniref:ATP-binding protein n=1 Tax=Alteromonas facilis TaxID=2048004 RepID=UPI000C2829A5|nr:ATP-binding protein [Alteromonas facilis]